MLEHRRLDPKIAPHILQCDNHSGLLRQRNQALDGLAGAVDRLVVGFYDNFKCTLSPTPANV